MISLLFFTMLFGIIEGGRLLFTYHQVTNAAREAARFAVAHGSEGDSTSAQDMADYAADRTTGLSAANLTVVPNWPGDPNARNDQCPAGSNKAGCPVHVTVDYAYDPIIEMIFGVGPLNLSASSEMRIHY